MSSIPSVSNKLKLSRFGVAEGLLRVLAKKMPDADLNDAAITFQMNVIANRLHQANLYNINKENPQVVENLIQLMQFAEQLLDLAKNRNATKKILDLVEEIQTTENKYSDIVDVMILIANRENKKHG